MVFYRGHRTNRGIVCASGGKGKRLPALLWTGRLHERNSEEDLKKQDSDRILYSLIIDVLGGC